MPISIVWKLTAAVALTLVAMGALIAQFFLVTQVDLYGRPIQALDRLEARGRAAWQPMAEAFAQGVPPVRRERPAPAIALREMLRHPYVAAAYYCSPDKRLTVMLPESARLPAFEVDLKAWRPERPFNGHAPAQGIAAQERAPAMRKILVGEVVAEHLFQRAYSGWTPTRDVDRALFFQHGDPHRGWYAFKLDRERFLGDGFELLRRLGLDRTHEWTFSLAPARHPAGWPASLRHLSLEPTPVGVQTEWAAMLEDLMAPTLSLLGATLLGMFMTGRQVRALLRERTLALAQSNFVSGISHEMKAPLTTIKMYAEMVEQGVVSEPERRAAYMRTIGQESDRLTRLVENVLDYATVRKERRRYHFEPASARALIEEAVSSLEGPLRQAGMRVEVLAPMSLTVMADRDALVQALVNLIGNAIKYAPDEKVIVVTAEEAGQRVHVSVRDFGPGIPRREQRRIFRPFYRIGSELTRQAPGSGLGLALVREYVRAHGGKVELESQPGQGATFRLVLPQARSQA